MRKVCALALALLMSATPVHAGPKSTVPMGVPKSSTGPTPRYYATYPFGTRPYSVGGDISAASASASTGGAQQVGGGGWPQPPMPGMPVVNAPAYIDWDQGATASNTLDINPTSPEPITLGPGAEGAFRTTCLPSHANFDDPLIYPGSANVGRAHHHTYFGNTSTNATTNLDDMRSVGSSTCSGGSANKSAYWVASMIDTRDGHVIRPESIGVYYKSSFSSNPQNIINAPAGLKIFTGTPMATSIPTGQEFVTWFCHYERDEGSGPELRGYQIPACPYMTGTYAGNTNWPSTVVWALINFPNCWDGVNLDSPNHKSHMYHRLDNTPSGVCPPSHPYEIPHIAFNILWRLGPSDDPAYWRLSSDAGSGQPGWSLHGDWINGWDQTVMSQWIANCLHPQNDCHTDNIGTAGQPNNPNGGRLD